MEETSFFNEGGVSVSNSRFVAHDQTYAMSGITSVKRFMQVPSRKGPIILGVIAVIAMAFGGGAVIVGLLGFAGAVAWWYFQKPEFSVQIYTASGEQKALTRYDGDFISKVVDAVNKAIVHRG